MRYAARLVAVLALIAVVLAAVGVYLLSGQQMPEVIPALPSKGESFYGVESRLVDNARVDPEIVLMQPRGLCSWGQPGANPWRGDTYSALLALNVKAGVAKRIVARIRAGTATSVVRVTNKQVISEQGLVFSPWMGMTFGTSLCYGTRANFKDDSHVESGKVYAEDGYWIWVPDVCGNVSRLIPWYEATRNRYSEAPLVVVPPGYVEAPNAPNGYARSRRAGPNIPREAQPWGPIPAPESGTGGEVPGRSVNDVPEPETLALLLVGAMILYITRRKHGDTKGKSQGRNGEDAPQAGRQDR